MTEPYASHDASEIDPSLSCLPNDSALLHCNAVPAHRVWAQQMPIFLGMLSALEG